MKQIFILTFLILTTNNLFGQDWTENVKWLYNQEDNIPNDISEYVEFQKTGDTIISNRTCIQVEERYVKIENSEIVSLFLNNHILCNENKEIDYYNEEDSTFYVLYDFNLNEGDTSKSYCPFTEEYTYTKIDSIKEEEINGQMLKVQYHDNLFEISTPCELTWRVVENIGSENYLFPRYGGIDPPQGGDLICYLGSGNFVYPEGSQNCEIILSQKEVKTEELLIYPNPVNRILNLEMESFEFCILYDSSGKQISTHKEKQINMEKLIDGLYYLKIVTENNINLKKIVKASR